ncbi:MAG TPA: endonuclease [Bifidobacterium sp.]|nr:endonuclease [Bifidobacterium sp.]HCA74895.1 endonuclease [Bifidobacterium sp.]
MAQKNSRPAKAAKPIRSLKKSNNHRIRGLVCGFLGTVFAFAALLGTLTRILPEEIQALPYVPVVVSLVPWFALLAVVALACAAISKKRLALMLALLAVGLQVWWQYPFFYNGTKISRAAIAAVSGSTVNTTDDYAKLMTCNVYKGHADAQEIVDLVRSEHVEVLAMQETTDAFIDELNQAGIGDVLPYSQVSSSDGVYGNGLWSATPLADPSDDDVDSSASFMPGATIGFNNGATQVRFVSVHTTSPTNGYWQQWRRSLDELARMRFDASRRYVFMGDFNATTDHTPLRNMLGGRFIDAARQSANGLMFTWPANINYVPPFAGIDHIILDSGMQAGQTKTVKIDGTDHKALLTTVQFN